MGFNHHYFSNLENLKSEYNNIGLEAFIKRYRKYDAVTGPSECFRFLEEKQKEYELQQISLVDKGQDDKTIES